MEEQELILARQYASQYLVQQKNPLRQLISRSTYQAYIGERPVESFIALFKGLVDDETGELADHNIDVRLLYINSLKTQDVNLECLEEAKRGEDKEKISLRKANLIAMVKGAIEANVLTEADCKIHLSSQLLELAKVISSKVMFDRRLIRLNTAILYKQNKFNLLREDAVGYSALINDIIIGSIDLERDEFGRLPPTPLDRIPHFLDIISSHIGNFHLDPNRVLDVLLDFYIKEVMLNHVFWIELFKQSGWIRHLTLPPLTDDGDFDMDQQDRNHSSVMAHLLGFKFENYHVLEVSDAPQELYYSGALLIMNGLIRLGDLLPYLLPDEKQLETDKTDYLEQMNKEIKTNSGGLLAQYGALGEEGATKKAAKPTTVKEDDNENAEDITPIYKANDVVELTVALLSIGDLEHSEEILSKYNKLCDMYPTLAHYIYRLCDVILEPCYQHYVPDDIKARSTYFLECAQLSELKTVLSTGKGIQPKMPKLKTHYVLDTLKDGTHDLKKKQIYRFFYTKWRDHLKKAKTYNDLLTKFLPIMRLAGYRAYLVPNLFQKLIQILLALFERGEAESGAVQRRVCVIMIREFLLPAISFSDCNPGFVASVWEVLDLLTFQERCQLYGEWGNDFYKKTIETKLLKARVERSVRSVMRRVSKNDVRQCGRDLGKLAHSNPTIVFSVMLDQIQSFDNLAPYMADACRYMSNFSYDILGYFMTEKWTGSQGAGRMKKIKMKEDGIASSWLRALSVFSGMLYKKQGIDPTPLIRYMLYRLQYKDAVGDLVLFNEFVTKLCGIEIIGSAMTDEQITSAGCSDALRAEAFQPISSDNRRATKRVISRLKETLKKDNAALELLVLLYRLHESCSAKQDISTHERVNQLNHTHQSILQYTELLTTIFDEAEYSALIPSIDVLYKEYGLPYPAVMQIIRPKTRYLLRNSMDTDAKEDEPHPVLQPIIHAFPEMMKNENVISLINAEFFVLFWQLSLYDIHCPSEHYEAAIKRYTDTINQCRDPRSSFCQSNRPSVVAKAERQAQANLDALKVDLPKHQQDVEKTMGMLKASHSRWFDSTAERIPLIRCILQYCIYPRCVLSEFDAVYCYKFAMLMHQLNVNNYSSLTFFDFVLVESLPASMMTLTDYETTIQSRFIFRTFSKMFQWYQDEKLYTKEALGNGLIGFQKSWNVQTASELQKSYLLSYSDFKRVMAKWHQKSSALFEQALRSGESHQIRNAFLTLRQFIPCFPMIRDHGSTIVSATQHLASTEKRDDLKVLARSYLGLIEKSKSRWISKNAFIGLEDPEEPQSLHTNGTSSSQTNSKPSTPRSSSHHEDKTTDTSSQSANKNSSSHSAEAGSGSSSDRKKSSREEGSSSSSSNRGSSSYTSSGNSSSKKLRSDEISSSSSRREGSSSDLRHTSSSSRHYRSSEPSPNRHSPRESSSRGVEISTPPPPPPSSSSQTRDGVRIRDSARDAIREAAKDSSRSSSLPSASTTSFIGNSSKSNTSSTSNAKESSRDTRKSIKDERSGNSTSQPSSSSSSRAHRDSQDSRDKRGSSSSNNYTNNHSTSVSGSSSSHKRILEDDKEKEKDKGEKRYKTTERPRDDRREKDRPRDHHRDNRDSRDSKRRTRR